MNNSRSQTKIRKIQNTNLLSEQRYLKSKMSLNEQPLPIPIPDLDPSKLPKPEMNGSCYDCVSKAGINSGMHDLNKEKINQIMDILVKGDVPSEDDIKLILPDFSDLTILGKFATNLLMNGCLGKCSTGSKLTSEI